MLLPVPAAVAAGKEETSALRTTIGKWIEMMRMVQEEQARWTRERQILEANREGLQQEIADLEETIEATMARIAAADEESREKLDKKRRYDAAREAMAKSLTVVEERVREVLPLLPGFYLSENTKLAAAAEDLKKSAGLSEEEKKKGLTKRLSAVTTVLNEAEKLQQRAWVRDERREVDGENMIVTAIYFGLSTAFAADTAGTVALRGRPGPEGWEFEKISEPGAPEAVLDLIAVAEGSGEIKFVEVPVELR